MVIHGCCQMKKTSAVRFAFSAEVFLSSASWYDNYRGDIVVRGCGYS